MHNQMGPNLVPCFFLKFSFFYQKRTNRKVVGKGIYKKGYRKNKGKYPVSISYDLTYTVILVIM